MPRRTLALRRDTLTELSQADLAAVAGGDQPDTVPTLHVLNCLTLWGAGCIH